MKNVKKLCIAELKMGQIPTGEFCTYCPCLSFTTRGAQNTSRICALYDEWLEVGHDGMMATLIRLPQCIKDNPRIVKKGEKP
jgi:hypothetical protein